MADVTPAVSECLHARQGILQTCMEFGSDGVVVKAGKSWKGRGCTEFEEGPLAGPSEPCVKAALLGVRVPPFKAERFRLSYPFKAGG